MWRPGLGLAGKGGERRGVEDTSDVELHDLRKTGIGSGSGGTVSVQSARCHLAAVSEMYFFVFLPKRVKKRRFGNNICRISYFFNTAYLVSTSTEHSMCKTESVGMVVTSSFASLILSLFFKCERECE